MFFEGNHFLNDMLMIILSPQGKVCSINLMDQVKEHKVDGHKKGNHAALCMSKASPKKKTNYDFLQTPSRKWELDINSCKAK